MSDGATGPLELEPLPPRAPPPPPAAPVAAPGLHVPEHGTTVLGAKPRRFVGPLTLSLLVHALLLLLVAWLFSGQEAPERPPPVIHFRLGSGPVSDTDPEANAAGAVEPPVERPMTPDEQDAELLGGVAPGLVQADTRDETAIGAAAAPAGSLYQGRLGGKERLLLAGGGDADTEGALFLALDWLARHQAADGSWNARDFARLCGDEPCAGQGRLDFEEGTTALALLPFLGAGHTHRDGPWRETVRDGLKALLARQRPDGSFGTDERRAYAGALGALALCEAYGLTGARVLRAPAERATRYWVRTQSDRGGWRYDRGDGQADSSVTGWVALALVSAKKNGLAVPPETLEACRDWFRGRTSRDGTVGYVASGTGTTALVGVGLFVPAMLGADPHSKTLQPVVDRLERSLPRWPGEDGGHGNYGPDDPMHWYYGSLGAFQAGGGTWKVWHERLRPLLLDHQVRTGHARGSWEPVGETGEAGGRVVATALGALTLEVYYRYPRAVSVR